MTTHNKDYFKPEVFLLSDDTDLLENLKTNLISNKCTVVLMDINNEADKLDTYIDQYSVSGRSYLLAILNNCGKYGRNFTDKILDRAVEFVEKTDSKAIFVFPYSYFSEQEDLYEYWNSTILNNKKIYAGTIFLGDVLSNSSDRAPASFMDNFLFDLCDNNKKPDFLTNTPFNPITPETASNALMTALFSMGAYRSSSAIIGNDCSMEKLIEAISPASTGFTKSGKYNLKIIHPKSISQIRRFNQEITPLLEARKKLSVKTSVLEKEAKTRRINNKLITDFFVSIKNTKLFFPKKDLIRKLFKRTNSRSSDGSSSASSVTENNIELKKPKLKINIFFKLGSLLMLLILLPQVLLLSAGASLIISNYLFGASFVESSLGLERFSKETSGGARNLTLLFMKIPIAGKYYEPLFLDSEFIIKVADLQTSYRKLLINVAAFIHQSKNQGSEENTQIAKDISLEIDGIYSKTGFLEGEWVNDGGKKNSFQKRLFPGKDVNEVKDKLLDLKKIVDQSDQIFGVTKPTNYLVLFEDNSQIRPTGGKISAYGVITFTDAKITNIQILNFNDVDEKINGKIEPPEPLIKYFGKNSWYLSDSNWYVDFPSSAEKAEWFLDKGLDIPVDGVISIDSVALDELSKATKRTLNDPESPETKELTEYLRGMTSLDERGTYRLIFKTIDLLNEKHILVFNHNNEVRNALNGLGWDGAIKDVDCVADCYLDAIGIIESANGIGSENIRKEASLRISVEEGLAKKTLNIFMENKNNFDYKTYLRILSGPNSGYSPVVITTQDEKYQKYPEIYGVSGYKEAGIYLEFKPLETKAISFSWENAIENFSNVARYSILIRKQPGEQGYPFDISLENKSKSLDRSTPEYSLTNDGTWSYNTNLLSDFVSTFVWKK